MLRGHLGPLNAVFRSPQKRRGLLSSVTYNVPAIFMLCFLSDGSFDNSPVRDFLGIEAWGTGYQETQKYMKLKVPMAIGIESQPLYLGIDILVYRR